jgi:hypothetical protein
MPTYVPSHRYWVREQVELYESSGGTKGTILRDTGLPVILVDASQGRRQLRARGLPGRSPERPRLGVQPARQSADEFPSLSLSH